MNCLLIVPSAIVVIENYYARKINVEKETCRDFITTTTATY